ncbi:MAG: flavodoxin family protein [Desulfobulbus sp.]|nr:MAG: flavodoxin family protein [Desulfobulbus sp.]
MKVVAFNGSARKGGNTEYLIKYVFEELEKEGIETELVNLSGKHPHGCIACYQCFKKKNRRCIVDADCINECIEKMEEADGIILASPTYFADLSSELKALIDRTGMVSRANGDMYRRKVGAAVVARRRGGAIHVFDSINHFFTMYQMNRSICPIFSICIIGVCTMVKNHTILHNFNQGSSIMFFSF